MKASHTARLGRLTFLHAPVLGQIGSEIPAEGAALGLVYKLPLAIASAVRVAPYAPLPSAPVATQTLLDAFRRIVFSNPVDCP